MDTESSDGTVLDRGVEVGRGRGQGIKRLGIVLNVHRQSPVGGGIDWTP